MVRKEGEADFRCPNRRGCPSQGIEALFHFAGRGAMDIEHLGYMTLMRLFEAGLIEDVADIYALDADKLSQLPGFKDRSITNVLEQVEASKDRPLWRLLVGLNIRHVGSHVAQVLARAFGSIDALAAASEDEIDAVPEIGPEIAATVREWFDDPDNLALIDKLRAAGVRLADDRAGDDGRSPSRRWKASRSSSPAGWRPSLARKPPSARRPPARASPPACRRRPRSWWREPDPGTKLAKAESLGVEVIDEAGVPARLDGVESRVSRATVVAVVCVVRSSWRRLPSTPRCVTSRTHRGAGDIGACARRHQRQTARLVRVASLPTGPRRSAI